MTKKNIAILIAFGIFAVIVLVLVVVGITTHTEPGLVDPQTRWNHVPLSVGCQGYTPPDAEACRTVSHVVDTINRRLGFQQLDYDGATRDADIQWTMRAPIEVGSNGPCGQPGECFELTGRGHTYEYCTARTMNVSGPNDLEWLVVYHGFGHCLGLAHDDYELSIMFPTQRPTPDRTIPPWFSDFDRELLRGKYGGR